MERRKKNVFICLYIVLWLAQLWLALVRRAPLTAVVLAVLYILVLTERKLAHYILYGWCGFGTLIAAGNIFAGYNRRPREETNVLVLILALTVAAIILTGRSRLPEKKRNAHRPRSAVAGWMPRRPGSGAAGKGASDGFFQHG